MPANTVLGNRSMAENNLNKGSVPFIPQCFHRDFDFFSNRFPECYLWHIFITSLIFLGVRSLKLAFCGGGVTVTIALKEALQSLPA